MLKVVGSWMPFPRNSVRLTMLSEAEPVLLVDLKAVRAFLPGVLKCACPQLYVFTVAGCLWGIMENA